MHTPHTINRTVAGVLAPMFVIPSFVMMSARLATAQVASIDVVAVTTSAGLPGEAGELRDLQLTGLYHRPTIIPSRPADNYTVWHTGFVWDPAGLDANVRVPTTRFVHPSSINELLPGDVPTQLPTIVASNQAIFDNWVFPLDFSAYYTTFAETQGVDASERIGMFYLGSVPNGPRELLEPLPSVGVGTAPAWLPDGFDRWVFDLQIRNLPSKGAADTDGIVFAVELINESSGAASREALVRWEAGDEQPVPIAIEMQSIEDVASDDAPRFGGPILSVATRRVLNGLNSPRIDSGVVMASASPPGSLTPVPSILTYAGLSDGGAFAPRIVVQEGDLVSLPTGGVAPLALAPSGALSPRLDEFGRVYTTGRVPIAVDDSVETRDAVVRFTPMPGATDLYGSYTGEVLLYAGQHVPTRSGGTVETRTLGAFGAPLQVAADGRVVLLAGVEPFHHAVLEIAPSGATRAILAPDDTIPGHATYGLFRQPLAMNNRGLVLIAAQTPAGNTNYPAVLLTENRDGELVVLLEPGDTFVDDAGESLGSPMASVVLTTTDAPGQGVPSLMTDDGRALVPVQLEDGREAMVLLTFDASVHCPADMALPKGVLNLADVQRYLGLYLAGSSLADFDGSTVLSFADVQAFLGVFNSGCE